MDTGRTDNAAASVRQSASPSVRQSMSDSPCFAHRRPETGARVCGYAPQRRLHAFDRLPHASAPTADRESCSRRGESRRRPPLAAAHLYEPQRPGRQLLAHFYKIEPSMPCSTTRAPLGKPPLPRERDRAVATTASSPSSSTLAPATAAAGIGTAAADGAVGHVLGHLPRCRVSTARWRPSTTHRPAASTLR